MFADRNNPVERETLMAQEERVNYRSEPLRGQQRMGFRANMEGMVL